MRVCGEVKNYFPLSASFSTCLLILGPTLDGLGRTIWTAGHRNHNTLCPTPRPQWRTPERERATAGYSGLDLAWPGRRQERTGNRGSAAERRAHATRPARPRWSAEPSHLPFPRSSPGGKKRARKARLPLQIMPLTAPAGPGRQLAGEAPAPGRP